MRVASLDAPNYYIFVQAPLETGVSNRVTHDVRSKALNMQLNKIVCSRKFFVVKN